MNKNTNVVREFYNSPNEYFQRTDVPSEISAEFKDTETRCIFIDTAAGNDFYGKFENVKRTFQSHSFTNESKMISGIVQNLKSVDFSQAKWQFARRMTMGCMVDIGRYLDGRQDFWCGFKRNRKAKRTVRIYVQFGGNSHRTAEELAVPGAIAVTIAEVLESMGVDVELWGATYDSEVYGNKNSWMCDTDLCQLILIKPANSFADYGLINYVIGNNHWFRNIGFRNICLTGESHGWKVASCLGSIRNIDAEKLGLSEEDKDGAIIIPSIYDVDEAKNYLTNLINDKIKRAA